LPLLHSDAVAAAAAWNDDDDVDERIRGCLSWSITCHSIIIIILFTIHLYSLQNNSKKQQKQNNLCKREKKNESLTNDQCHITYM